jgi:hypothetical protein
MENALGRWILCVDLGPKPYIRFYTGINRKQGVGAMQPRREKKIAQKEKKEDA